MQDHNIPPREVLNRLRTIPNFYSLNQQDRYNYLYLRAKACNELGRIRRTDTILDEGVDFFVQMKQYEKAILLSIGAGKAYLKACDYIRAGICYAEAEELAEKLKDNVFLFQIYYELANLYNCNHDEENALKYFQKMHAFYELHPELESKLEYGQLLFYFGDCLVRLEEYEKALEIFRRLTVSVNGYQDSVALARIFFKMAYSLEKTEDFEQARMYLYGLQELGLEDGTELRGLLLMAKINLQEQSLDSLTLYLQKVQGLLKDSDFQTQEAYYYLLSGMYELQGDYRQALYCFKQYDRITDSTYTRKMQVRSERFVELRKQLKLHKQVLALHHEYLMTVFSAVLLIISLAFIAFILYKRSRRRRLQCIEAEDFIEKLNHIVDSNASKLQELLSHNLDINKKISRLKSLPYEKNIQQIRNFNEIFYNGKAPDELDWEEIYFTINFLYNDFKDKLISRFPQLNDKEVQLCCLLRAGFDTSDCAFMVEQSIYSVQKRKTTIRKKLGIDEGGNIIDFLNSRLSGNKD